MEYLDKSYGSYNAETGEMLLRFQVRDTRCEGRMERIETVKTGSEVCVIRDSEKVFSVLDSRDLNVGNMPPALGSALAPLVDAEKVIFPVLLCQLCGAFCQREAAMPGMSFFLWNFISEFYRKVLQPSLNVM